MLLLFNKTIKPLNHFVLGAIADSFLYHFWENIFQDFFFYCTQVFMNLSFTQSIRKRNNQAIDRNGSNIHREKLIM